MWLLDSEAFPDRRLWLRPGKKYLFGRTAAEPGQLAISHITISRRHLTITVEDVQKDQAYRPSSRSTLTLEDLKTKTGTTVNGKKIKNKQYVVEGDNAEFTMGKCPHKFRITWSPVVFSFSFTKKELQNNPLEKLQEKFEPLDIKLMTDYVEATTHVISKKRNTAKGLQALINGGHIVNESYLEAIVEACAVPDVATDSSSLENDFDAHWPDAMQHLPPPGGEPVQRPDSAYAPDPERRDLFEGYTFIFYEKSQYTNLLAPITSGSGKALLGDVVPKDTSVDEFVQYVKGVAGEKGLGAFDDGSEGKGVVLVRYLPSKGELLDWYTEFLTAVSLRLDHRPIEQSEFLEAILGKDASILRRPLEVESTPNTQEPAAEAQPAPERADVNVEPEVPAAEPVEETQAAPRRGRARRTVKRRFAGFDDDVDIDMDEKPPPPAPAPAAAPGPASQPPVEEEGLFVSQDPNPPQPLELAHNARRSQRKRHASPLPEDDLMQGMAPAVAKFKRVRLEMGEDDAPPEPEKPAEPAKAEPKKKIKKEFDILEMAARNREQEEARARAEKEDLANLPDDVDLSEIRRLNIVEEMELRAPASQTRSREADIASGRWNPKWNGLKNFKKFRSRGEVTGRPVTKVIVPLTEAKTKEFGVGDDYWLEDEDTQRKKKQTSQVSGGIESEASAPQPAAPSPKRPAPRRTIGVVLSDSSDEEAPPAQDVELTTRTRTRGAASQPQRASRSQSSRVASQGSKRAAPEPAKEQAPKRQRQARKPITIADSDDSDDELKFRFGKRR